MLSLTTTSWLKLTIVVLETYGYQDLDDIRSILYDHYRVRAQFASPYNESFRYLLDFDDSRLETIFLLKYSQYLDVS